MSAKHIVLTGGPCGGKTTAKSYLSQKLADIGILTMFVPEVATFLISAGLDPRRFPHISQTEFLKLIIRFQDLLLRTQMHFEEIFGEAIDIMAEPKTDSQLFIYDRGFIDARPYFPTPEDFQTVLRKNHWNEVALRDRYDGVLHLVTVADGAESFYNCENNPARRETLEEAREMDRHTREVWLGHPHLRIIDNSTDFAGKMKRTLREIQKILGVPVALETERKFKIINPFTLAKIPVAHQVIDVEQFYIQDNSGQEVRVRRRSQKDSGVCYYKTIKFDTASVRSRVEIEDRISELDYYRSLTNQRPDYEPIRKQRICFLWQNQYFELDIFLEPQRHTGLVLLEIELTEENDIVSIPNWLGPVEEVTENPKYKNSSLARRQ